MAYAPDPENLSWDEDMGAYRDSESGDYFRDLEGEDLLFDD